MNQMNQVLEDVFVKVFPDPNTRPKKIAKPFKDGDNAENSDGFKLCEKYEFYKNMIVVPFSTSRAPGVIDTNNRAIHDPEELYNGCYVQLQLQATHYEFKGKKGLRFIVANVLKVRDGERLGGGGESAQSAFAGLVKEKPEEAAGGAGLSSLF